MSFDSKLQLTEDGSLSVFDPETRELYHNRAGAYTEALNNYCLPSGLIEKLQNTDGDREVALVDACFGLGYNTFVLVEQAARACQNAAAGATLRIVGVEIDAAILESTVHILRDDRFAMMHDALQHSLPLGFGSYKFVCGKLNVQLDVSQGDLRQCIPALTGEFDAVFHDPFSPRKVPELWTLELFIEYHRLVSARRGAVLTYSSAKAVRGAIRAAGFRLYKTTGVGGKSGGTLGAVDDRFPANPNVSHLSPEELKVVESNSGTPYRDEGFASARQDILRRRERELVSGYRD